MIVTGNDAEAPAGTLPKARFVGEAEKFCATAAAGDNASRRTSVRAARRTRRRPQAEERSSFDVECCMVAPARAIASIAPLGVSLENATAGYGATTRDNAEQSIVAIAQHASRPAIRSPFAGVAGAALPVFSLRPDRRQELAQVERARPVGDLPGVLAQRKACAGGDAAHAAEQSAADFAEQRAQNLAADLLDVLRRESDAERREQLLHVVAVELEAVTRAASVAR